MRPRILATACAPAPGTGPDAAAILGLSTAVYAEIDMVTVKTAALAHSEQIGRARMFRVPVPQQASASEQRAHFGRAVLRQLDAELYDVVHVRGAFEGLEVARRRSSYGFRFVYEVGAFPDEAEGAEAERAWNEAHLTCLTAADLILVPTHAARRALVVHGVEDHVEVVPSGVDLNAFDWLPTAPGEVPRFIFLGDFGADRDLSTLLGAIKRLSKERPLELLMLGDAVRERRQRWRRVVESMDMAAFVQVRGEPRADAVPGLIATADFAIVSAAATPRFQELGDLPQPFLEAMACMRPIVAAAVPAVSEVIRDEQEGLLYLPGDEASLYEGLKELIADPALARQLGRAAYDRVRELFGEGARRRRLIEVYDRLIPGSQSYDPWQEAFDREESHLALDATSEEP